VTVQAVDFKEIFSTVPTAINPQWLKSGRANSLYLETFGTNFIPSRATGTLGTTGYGPVPTAD
jgi:hypothetical protein